MTAFSSKPLKPSPLLQAIRKRPFLLFGLPFVGIMVGASFALEKFTQTKYDYESNKIRTMSWEEELGMKKNRKKVDLREEYYRMSNPSYAEHGLDASLAALSSTQEAADPDKPVKKKRKPLSMAPIPQDQLENVRVPRPPGVPEWGAPASEDAPIKGRRKEDRWV